MEIGRKFKNGLINPPV